MHDVFISYAKANGNVADAICHSLEGRGVRCWYAPRNIDPGKTWSAAIIDGIDGARVMVVVLSEHSNDSVHVRNEIERAVHRGRLIIPVRIEDVEPSKDLELFLSSHHWLDAMTPPIEKHLTTLADTITRHLDMGEADLAAAPPPPPPPAPSVVSTRSSGGRLLAVFLLLALAGGGYWYYTQRYQRAPDRADTMAAADLVAPRAAVRDTRGRLEAHEHSEHPLAARMLQRAAQAETEARRLEGAREFAAAHAEWKRARKALQDGLEATSALAERPASVVPAADNGDVAAAFLEATERLAEGDQKLTDGDVSGARAKYRAAAAGFASLRGLNELAIGAEVALEKVEKLLTDPAFDAPEASWATLWNKERALARELAKEARTAYDAGEFEGVEHMCTDADRHAWAFIRGYGPGRKLASRLDAVNLDWGKPVYSAVVPAREECRATIRNLFAALAGGALPEDEVQALENRARALGERHDRAWEAAVRSLRTNRSSGSAYAAAEEAFGEGRFDEVVALLAKESSGRTAAKKLLSAAESMAQRLPQPLAVSAAKEVLAVRMALGKAAAAYKSGDDAVLEEAVAAVKQSVAAATRIHNIAAGECKDAQSRYMKVARHLAGRPVNIVYAREARRAAELAKRGAYRDAWEVYLRTAALMERDAKSKPTPTKPRPVKPTPIKPRPVSTAAFVRGSVYYGSVSASAGGQRRRRSRASSMLLYFAGKKGDMWSVTLIELGPPPVRSSLTGKYDGKTLRLQGRTRTGTISVVLAKSGDTMLSGSATRGGQSYSVRLRRDTASVPKTAGRRYNGEFGKDIGAQFDFRVSRTAKIVRYPNRGVAEGTLVITQGRSRYATAFRGTLYGRYLIGAWKQTGRQKVWTEGSFWLRIDDPSLYGRWSAPRHGSGSIKAKR